MTSFITANDARLESDNCISIRNISIGLEFVEDGCNRNYVLHNCILVDTTSAIAGDRNVYVGDISLRFDEYKNCKSVLIDADSLKEICTGQQPSDLDGLRWVGFLQPKEPAVN